MFLMWLQPVVQAVYESAMTLPGDYLQGNEGIQELDDPAVEPDDPDAPEDNPQAKYGDDV